MNERFEKLAEQATEYATFRHPVSNIVLAVERDKFEQKFAELIVKECLVQIGDAIPDTNCSAADAYKTAKLAATSRVKEYFGVEE